VAKIVQASEAAIPADQQIALGEMTMMLRGRRMATSRMEIELGKFVQQGGLSCSDKSLPIADSVMNEVELGELRDHEPQTRALNGSHSCEIVSLMAAIEEAR
jgi:hypothetical protein